MTYQLNGEIYSVIKTMQHRRCILDVLYFKILLQVAYFYTICSRIIGTISITQSLFKTIECSNYI